MLSGSTSFARRALPQDEADDRLMVLELPMRLRFRGGRSWVVTPKFAFLESTSAALPAVAMELKQFGSFRWRGAETFAHPISPGSHQHRA